MQVYTVTELTDYVKSVLENDSQLSDIWVTGEVSSLHTSDAGHRYFTFKDSDGQIKAVLFSRNRGGEHVTPGTQVNIHGRVSFYPVRGDVQLYADVVMPVGDGILAAEFERMRLLLEAEGLFETGRKRNLPDFPHRIGIVTSAQGAVIHDITKVLTERYPLGELVLCSATVQGEQAPHEISTAIRTLNEQPDLDVIIVGRGGGSAEDLWAFNTEEVARAIYASRVPIVSAIGHESDTTIADYVADLRAATPSAAAAAVAPDLRVIAREIVSLALRSANAISRYLADRRDDVDSNASQMYRRLPDIPTQRQRVDDVVERAKVAFGTSIFARREKAHGLQQTLEALNPVAVLERGFAVVTTPDGRAIISSGDVNPNDIVRTTLHDGNFKARVQ